MPKFLPYFHVALGVIAAIGISGCHPSSANKAGNAVPVVAGKVRQHDTPIFLDGIGTAVAFNTVTVHAQVDGLLQSVAFNEGQDVLAGDLLAVIDPRTFQAQTDEAKAKKAQDEAQLDNAKTTYDRSQTLLAKGMIDQQTVDTQKAAVDQFLAAVQADDAAIEQASVQLGYTRIIAPISGRAGIRQIDAGNIIHAADTNGLGVITQLKPISVIFTLPQQNWPQIQQLTAADSKLTVVAYDRDSRAPIDQGVLSVVDNQIDTTTGTIKLKATFPNEKLALWPGQFVNVRLLVETRKNGLTVPASVIQRGPQGTYAFVIKADGTVEVRPVQVAQIDAGTALIDQGLAPGEQVVVDGQYKLQDGSSVTIQSPGGNTAGTSSGSGQKHQDSSP
ncbi:MAG TPA: efflux RND transporter periplasmic adaptor subunit [Opitutaceae bacterium]|jgi:multidrug efflux system membrane fusion protein|nr:efflux RND transporter periplasmic adaptor subunit [Opitutaceae bacterium]